MLQQQTAARDLLAQHGGQTFEIQANPVSASLTIDNFGALSPTGPTVKPDVLVVVDTRELWASGWRPGQAFPERSGLVHVSGDAAFAKTLALLAKHCRPDLEDLLAQRIGDIPARQLTMAFQRIAGVLVESADRVAGNLAEYITHEAQVLPSQQALTGHENRLKDLHSLLGRLAARTKSLDHRLGSLSNKDREQG
jgi:ubiquinone biosynthesis protein UbiJ